ncbi:glycosyltransferase family 9 protein [Methanocaldococcus fervens]|uniref:Glycosyl transferase family 9 n=1 Tax=Methanocaldococcus fervens (strain DSM 4213 / JCM 15782 / AG86) TaxID=573064 RepID=C7P6Z2_METFA|nr:glycosyltransferase family 9 protein [Methanocaldococcus fervens]ACV24324.1 glycosyl transferase family 9 [Methanocaldococcus fervens AG86]
MDIDKIRIIDYYIGIPIIQFLRLFKIKKKELKNKPKKILLIKFFGIGNLVMSSPVFYHIKNKYPNAEIHYLTLKNNEDVLKCYKKYVDKIKYIDIKDNIILATLKLINDLRKENYDVIIDLDQFSRYSAIISFLINKNFSIGFKTRGAYRHYLYDHIIEYMGNKHIVEEFLDLLEPLGIKPNKNIKLIPLETDNTSKKKVDEFLTKHGFIDKKIIGIHTGTSENAPQRKWPYFKELIEKILLETDCYIVLTAGPKEYSECDNLINSLNVDEKYKERIIVSKGISLKELPELIKRFVLYISNDTGPLHIAAAQGVFVIGLYGPNTPKLYGPYTKNCYVFYKNLPCSPCITNFNNKKTTCKNPICMKKISVDEVFNKILEYLK